MRTPTVSLITVQPDALIQLIHQAVADALQAAANRTAADSAGLSLNAAARLARRRREEVAKALESGALPGKRIGKPGRLQRWCVVAGDLRSWLSAGCPTGRA